MTEGRRIKVQTVDQLMPESSWYGSDGQPPSSRTSSGRSWLTRHQEPMDGHYISSSSIMPEVEDAGMSRFGLRQREAVPSGHGVDPVYRTEQNHGPDHGRGDHDYRRTQKFPTRSVLYDREEETELTEVVYDNAPVPVAVPGSPLWDIGHMTMDQALAAWGISDTFEGKSWRIGLTKQRQAR